MYLNFSIFTVFLKNRNIIYKMKISKVTDYAPLNSVFTIIIIPTQDYLHNRCIRQEYSHLHTLIEVYTLLTKCLH